MSSSADPEGPPDENEAFANLDEALDDEDAFGSPSGPHPEGERDLDAEIVVDEQELVEAGANLDDPERIALLQGGIDDPDGTGPLPRLDIDRGWDVDPCWERASSRPHRGRRRGVPAGEDEGLGGYAGEANFAGADGDAVSEDALLDVPDMPEDPELEIIPMSDLDEIADDSPGPDSASW